MSAATREERGRSRSRLLKIECGSCGVILRGSAAALRQGLPRHGTPQCSTRGCKKLRQPLDPRCETCAGAEEVPF